MKRLSIRDIPGLGRGVFADEPISAWEVITADPVVEVPEVDLLPLKSTRMREYYWDWPGGAAVVFGPGSMMNHAYAPNADYHADVPARRMVFVAVVDIPAGREIRIDYRPAAGRWPDIPPDGPPA